MEEKEITIKQRLEQFAMENCSSVREFERSCGMSEGALRACERSISSKLLLRIRTKYPTLNPWWVMTGELPKYLSAEFFGQTGDLVDNLLQRNRQLEMKQSIMDDMIAQYLATKKE